MREVVIASQRYTFAMHDTRPWSGPEPMVTVLNLMAQIHIREHQHSGGPAAGWLDSSIFYEVVNDLAESYTDTDPLPVNDPGVVY